jgi:integrase
MAQNLLTDKALRALSPGNKEIVRGDGGGLWVRVLPQTSGGAINFYYRFELHQKERRFNCGTYPATSLAEARARRDDARKLVKQGIDPVDKALSDRASNLAAQALDKSEKTVEELFGDWKRVYLSAHRKDGGKSAQAFFKKDVLPEIGAMKAKEVRRKHIVQVIDRLLDRDVRRSATLALSSMRQMFRHGMGRDIVETDPTLGIARRHAGGTAPPADRNFSVQEVKELASKLPQSGLPARLQAAIWFLVATGARVGELSKSRWAEMDRSKKTWLIPAENSKNGRAHLIHLSKFALRQLKAMEELREGEFVLSGRKQGTHLDEKTLSKAIRDRIRTKPLPGRSAQTGTLLLSGGEWSVHDLRRTFASRLGDLGIAPHVIERCLNHVQTGIVKVYQQQEYVAERKAALEKWGKQLSGLTSIAHARKKATSSAKPKMNNPRV